MSLYWRFDVLDFSVMSFPLFTLRSENQNNLLSRIPLVMNVSNSRTRTWSWKLKSAWKTRPWRTRKQLSNCQMYWYLHNTNKIFFHWVIDSIVLVCRMMDSTLLHVLDRRMHLDRVKTDQPWFCLLLWWIRKGFIKRSVNIKRLRRRCLLGNKQKWEDKDERSR